MLLCLTFFKIFISLSIRVLSATCNIFSLSNIFTATFSPVISCVAKTTIPKVPCPNFSPSTK